MKKPIVPDREVCKQCEMLVVVVNGKSVTVDELWERGDIICCCDDPEKPWGEGYSTGTVFEIAQHCPYKTEHKNIQPPATPIPKIKSICRRCRKTYDNDSAIIDFEALWEENGHTTNCYIGANTFYVSENYTIIKECPYRLEHLLLTRDKKC